MKNRPKLGRPFANKDTKTPRLKVSLDHYPKSLAHWLQEQEERMHRIGFPAEKRHLSAADMRTGAIILLHIARVWCLIHKEEKKLTPKDLFTFIENWCEYPKE